MHTGGKGAVSCRAAAVSQACPSHQAPLGPRLWPSFLFAGDEQRVPHALARIRACRLSNPAFVKTSFRPYSYPGAVQALDIAQLFLDGRTVRRHIVLLRSLVFISLLQPVAQRQPLEVAPTLDAHCTGCCWFQTLHQILRPHIPSPDIHHTQTTHRFTTSEFFITTQTRSASRMFPRTTTTNNLAAFPIE
jgi:hypothetical protein